MSDYSGLIRAKLAAHFESHPHGSKTEFCRATGVHPQNLKNWMAGRAIPLDEVDAIAKGLGFIDGWDLLKPLGAKPEERDSSRLFRDLLPILAALDDDGLEAILELARTLTPALSAGRHLK